MSYDRCLTFSRPGQGADSARGDFEPGYFVNICANAIKLQEFFTSLSEK